MTTPGSASFKDIEAVSKNVLSASNGLFVVEWELDQAPDGDWEQYLRSSGVEKRGSLGFIYTEPEVIGRRVRIRIPDADLENAVRYVEASIPAANQKYRTYVVARRERQAAEKQARDAADASRLEQARERIRELDESG